ncbi:MAG: DUF1232 domain-containing protein [Paludibacteraceae bacterium]|nr:DUF1232 domain-containing protein [Paludibacteraceae bacterium]
MAKDFDKKYSKKFSEDGFWNKLKKYSKKMGMALVENALILIYALPNASYKDKMIIIGALGYLISPLDVIPDLLPGGFVDDAGVIAGAVARIRLSASPEVIAKAEKKAEEFFG